MQHMTACTALHGTSVDTHVPLFRAFSGVAHPYSTTTLLHALSRVAYFYRGKALHVPASLFKVNLLVIVHQLLEAGVQNVVVFSPTPVNDAAADTAQVRSVAASLCSALTE